MAQPLKLGVLISGSGSNLQSIIDNIEKGALKAAIKIVISNNPHSFGITRAQTHGLPVAVLKQEDFKTREDFDAELIRILRSKEIDLVVLAGLILKLARYEMLGIGILIVLVISAEMINTSIEEVVNLLVNEHRLEAKIAKDVSAGMVLLVAIFAAIVGVFIFLPHILTLLRG